MPRMKRAVRASSLGFTLLYAGLAGAEPSALQRSTAEALFQQGVELTQTQNYAEACPKFEASLEVDRAIGTMLRLADCYDRAGKSASAWGLFEQVAALAAGNSDETRLDIARERLSDLEQRLSLIQLVFPEALAGRALHVQLGAVVVPRAAAASPLPIDPGPAKLSVSEPGYATWRSTPVVPVGPSLIRVEVPVLEPTPIAPAAPSSAPPAPESSIPAWSYVLGAAGLAGMGVGGYLAYRAHATNEDSLPECRPGDVNACTPRGVQIRNDARALAHGSTISFAAGGVALLAAVSIAVWGRETSEKPATSSVRAQAFASTERVDFSLQGEF